MTNEELQTLIKNACKAAGWRIKRLGPDSHGATTIWIDDAPVIVKLADDDGDSRMLQVACRIGMSFTHDDDGVWSVMATNAECDKEAWEHVGTDARLAARMAVLRCAAMIGEAMG